MAENAITKRAGRQAQCATQQLAEIEIRFLVHSTYHFCMYLFFWGYLSTYTIISSCRATRECHIKFKWKEERKERELQTSVGKVQTWTWRHSAATTEPEPHKTHTHTYALTDVSTFANVASGVWVTSQRHRELTAAAAAAVSHYTHNATSAQRQPLLLLLLLLLLLPANWTRIARFMAIEPARERVRERVRFQYRRVCMYLFLTLFAGRINCIIDKRLLLLLGGIK